MHLNIGIKVFYVMVIRSLWSLPSTSQLAHQNLVDDSEDPALHRPGPTQSLVAAGILMAAPLICNDERRPKTSAGTTRQEIDREGGSCQLRQV
ncbi:hypothetical protein RRG08_061896 [Elysia crispata]|uniref:Secreted protein n=1 Tax=Elysia crispata TaxID=231223 RepID=A0AAE0XN54_9GAST|nr:hypothetical protein RRG08_061896 [Elysia crispata]